MLDSIANLRFDFEKQYLLDIHLWSQQFVKRGVLLDQYVRSKSDIEEGEILEDEFRVISGITGMVKTGLLCGHRRGKPLGVLTWDRNDDGRVWTGAKVGIMDDELHASFKLKCLLKTEVDTMKRLLNCRKSLLKAFDKYEALKFSLNPKPLFKEGMKLDKLMTEYRTILNREMTLRRVLCMKLICRMKQIGKNHKALFSDFTKQFTKVVDILCYGRQLKPDDNDDIERSIRVPTRKCYHCRQVDGEIRGIMKIKKVSNGKEGEIKEKVPSRKF